MNLEEVRQSLDSAGIKPGDILMVHGDAIVAAQLNLNSLDKVTSLLLEIVSYLGNEGTLVIPSFTYSFTKSELFDVAKSESAVGIFSEKFRLLDGVVRSKHPIFSVCAIGKYKNDFENSDCIDSFGKDSCFALIHKLDGKVMNLGCEFMITFAHYVEQMHAVSYRYFKDFHGSVTLNGKNTSACARYFVGDPNIQYHLNLARIKKLLVAENKLKIVPFGRFASYTIKANDFYQYAKYMLEQDEYSLIEEGNGKRR